MGKLSTRDIKGESISKALLPGNAVCKINEVILEPVTYKEGGLNLILVLESEPIAGFEGFLINKDDASKGSYKGQIGKVKVGEWAFADGETKSGTKVYRDNDILRFIKNLCTALGKLKWLEDQDGKHDDIQSLVNAFDKEKPFKDIFLNYCICGKEYQNKKNYTNYDLYLPRFTKIAGPFAPKTDKSKLKVITFDESKHITKRKSSETVSEFGGAPVENKDFNL